MVDLGLKRKNVSIWWQEKSRGKLKDIRQQIQTMLKYEDPPNILIIHVAGNDIAATKTIELCIKIRNVLYWSRSCLPSSMLAWSQILPRLKPTIHTEVCPVILESS
jgi:hypothetical protein